MSYSLSETICAQSTPNGRGGIHIIRVSGDQALAYINAIFKCEKGKVLKSNYVYYGFVIDPSDQEQIDEVLVTYFKKGKSFTTEETIEISCHGNPLIVKKIIELLVKQGCRLAERGEFTYRAFKGGRLTLNQAESVLSLIDSNNASLVSRSLRLLNGEANLSLKEIENQLIWIISRLEARIDFSTEDIEIVNDHLILEKIALIEKKLSLSLKNFKLQLAIDKGIKTVIIGPPNAGKSSLFNYLIGEKRSIVSEVPGTTRDYIAETISLNGKTFELIDTAGLRETNQDIESQGIGRVKDLISKADLIIILGSADSQTDHFFEFLSEKDLELKKLVFVFNKVDLGPDFDLFQNMMLSKGFDKKVIPISVLNNLGLDRLMTVMSESFDVVEFADSIQIINLRQSLGLEAALVEVNEGLNALNSGLGDEFVLSHLNMALKHLMSLFHIDNEEIIRDKIFKDFCLGK